MLEPTCWHVKYLVSVFPENLPPLLVYPSICIACISTSKFLPHDMQDCCLQSLTTLKAMVLEKSFTLLGGPCAALNNREVGIKPVTIVCPHPKGFPAQWVYSFILKILKLSSTTENYFRSPIPPISWEIRNKQAILCDSHVNAHLFELRTLLELGSSWNMWSNENSQ